MKTSRRLLAFLLVTLVVEAALAFVLRNAALHAFLNGDRGVTTDIEVLALGWIPVQAVAVVFLARALSHAAVHSGAGEERVLADVAAASRDWVWAADAQFRITYSNDSARDVPGYEPEELRGKPLPSLLAPADLDTGVEVLETALACRRGWKDVELDFLRKDGRVVRLQGSAVAVRDGSGAVVGFRGVRRVVTASMAADQARAAAAVRVEQVIDHGDVVIALQPIVCVETGRLAGVEALARFPDGRSPADWFADARGTGLEVELELLTFGPRSPCCPRCRRTSTCRSTPARR